MAGVFNSAGAGFLSGENTKRSFTTIAFGDTKPTVANFTMIDESQGAQASRIQVDATLDGGLHVVGTTTGTGSYSAVFYDGPICNKVNRELAMKKYLSLKTLKDRVATIYFYGDESTATQSSKAIAKFSGVLNNMAVSLVEDNSLVYLRVALGMIGSWQSQETPDTELNNKKPKKK